MEKQANELLTDWLSTFSRGERSRLAHQIDRDRSSVTYWCDGSRMPNRADAARIEAISEGAIPASAWHRKEMTGTSTGSQALRKYIRDQHSNLESSAAGIEVNSRTFSRLVTGRGKPSQATLDKINKATGLRLTVDDF